jgi:hypothetical protein
MYDPRNPEKFSASEVNINWPLGWFPEITISFNSPRAAYIAAVKPASPEPIIMIL